jgi:hypothetical protein
MLNKIIEDRHVEDELSNQTSLSLSEGLKILSATVGRNPQAFESAQSLEDSIGAGVTAESTSNNNNAASLSPMNTTLLAEMAANALVNNAEDKKGSRVTFSLVRQPVVVL